MKSKDVSNLYNQVPVGTVVQITNERLPSSGQMRKAAVANCLGGGRPTAEVSSL